MEYKIIKPVPLLYDYVESFWMLASHTGQDKDIIILPDGRIDLIFAWSAREQLHVMLMNLDREASRAILESGTTMFAVSFKLPALEYILDMTDETLRQPISLPNDFWGVTTVDLEDLQSFADRVSTAMLAILGTQKIDQRKRKLFELLYKTKGSMTIAALSESSCWSARQINRYFNARIGLSLKEYCGILRFRASFTQLKEGRLFPEGDFADQAHFIKAIKKLSGVTPKELSKNKNDRFIQFSAIPEK
ncbi:AraC family transcriptional regulator [Pedobacter sp. L105]|uniref:helix-turn-helix domain-containing protein n=1 Tax=Pedobacter sp. L105 TaxID=1641871 RepID=UPI00131AB24C|nr:AraC family transcriptional regulator [Pedobacter sp. L105]